MGHKNVPIQQRTGPRNRALIEQRIAHTALEVSHAIMRGEDYGEYLLDPLYRLFDADAGAGLITRRPMSPAAASQLTVAAAGVAPVSEEQAIQARPFLGKQPGFLAMARFGATGSVRTSDHIDLPRFWTTESYWRTHGSFGGRYPAGALLF